MNSKFRPLLIAIAGSFILAGTVAAFYMQKNDRGELPVIEPSPDFTLVNQDNETVQLSQFTGKVKVLSFIYVKCHMASRCPLTTKNFCAMQKLLKDQQQDKTVFLSITFDPDSDTPGTMKRYAELYGADFSNWHFLTGSKKDIDAVCAAYQFIHEKQREDSPAIRHSLITFLIDQNNDVRKMYFANTWKPEEVVSDVLTLLN